MSEGTASERRIWWNGELVPWGDATVHVLSHSLQRGSLIFDYMSVHETPRGTAVFRLADHVERFLRSAALVGLPLELDGPALREAVCAAVRANPGAKSVKLCAFLPSIEIDVVPQDPRVTVAVAAYDPIADVAAKLPGKPHFRPALSVWLEKERRNRRDDIVPPQAKVAANYVSPMWAKWAARRAGYDEILLTDEEGNLAEGPTTNVFVVGRDGRLVTPPERRVLLGVTRRSILEIAKHDGLPCSEEPLPPAALFEAAECFLTGTTAGVWPVEKVDGREVGEACPGPVTARLRERFQQVASGQDPAFAHWLHVVDGD